MALGLSVSCGQSAVRDGPYYTAHTEQKFVPYPIELTDIQLACCPPERATIFIAIPAVPRDLLDTTLTGCSLPGLILHSLIASAGKTIAINLCMCEER